MVANTEKVMLFTPLDVRSWHKVVPHRTTVQINVFSLCHLWIIFAIVLWLGSSKVFHIFWNIDKHRLHSLRNILHPLGEEPVNSTTSLEKVLKIKLPVVLQIAFTDEMFSWTKDSYQPANFFLSHSGIVLLNVSLSTIFIGRQRWLQLKGENWSCFW